MKTRIIVGGVIHNENDEILLLKMAEDRGVFPGQWGLVGGGIDPNETMFEALQREVKEETGLEIDNMNPQEFSDDRKEKLMPDGSYQDIYMIYLIFDVKLAGGELKLNEEWSEYSWVTKENVQNYDLNEATESLFKSRGWL